MSTGIVTGPLADLALHIHELEQRATTAECGLEQALQEVGRLRARVEALESWLRDGCPAHGYHPHNGATCLDCPICRPITSEADRG